MTEAVSHNVCLSFDFDAVSVWLGDRPKPALPVLSRGEYGVRVGVPRILDLLQRYDIHSTFFVPGHTADSYPEVVERILEAGHELAHHGYGHEDPSIQSPDEERRSMEKGIEALERFLGHPPRGYRSPSFDFSHVTLSLLVEYGFAYDSSLFGDDFHPYHPRLGDRVRADRPLERGREVALWEFPVDFCLDDWPHFSFSFDSPRVGLSAPSKVFEVWAGEFDYMVQHEQQGVMTIAMHPQIIGRGHRMAMLEQFVEHVLAQGSARFARLVDLVP